MAKDLEAGVSFVDAMQKLLPDDEKMIDETIAVMKSAFIDLDNEALAAVLRS
jgi:hypothetical protein